MMLCRQLISAQWEITGIYMAARKWDGGKEEETKPSCISQESQVHWGPKQTKFFKEVPLLRVFLLPLSAHIRNYTINICSVFFCDYTRYLYEIIMYLAGRHILNKLTFLRYYVEAGEKRVTAVMMWENKLAPNNLLFFPPYMKIYPSVTVCFQRCLQSKSKCHLPSNHLQMSWV